MPRPTIQQIRGLGDMVTTYQWNMIFVTFPSALYGGVIPSSEDLNLRMISSTVPTKTIGDEVINVRGHKTSQSGQAEFTPDLELVFYETVDVLVSNFLLAWHETCTNTKTGTHGSKSQCECDIQLQQLNRQDEPIWLYSMHGCRLKSYTKGEFSGEDSLVQPKLTIKIDYFEEQAL
jgi:hypothetical protein